MIRDSLVCISCWLLFEDWPEGHCPNCGTRHQPLVMRREAYDKFIAPSVVAR